MPAQPTVFTGVTLGALSLPNRVLMAPMTRNRASAEGLATPMMADYYAQRASAGLIVAEMTHVSAGGRAYLNTPGISTHAEAAAWRQVTDAVHAAGGRIVVQLAHAGRASHPDNLPAGHVPVAPSAIAPEGQILTARGMQPFVTPRALDRDEIPVIVREFVHAARLAQRAGFDGVEIHGANGYLLDQFLRDGSNQRRDEYGGTPQNRARLLLEVVEGVTAVWGAERVGVRLSPSNPFNDMSDSNPEMTFSAAVDGLRRFGLAYLHLIDPAAGTGSRLTPRLKALFRGPVVANGGYSLEEANVVLARREADAVSFGVPFIANPDLPVRLASGAPLNSADPSLFYAGGERGYIDYPALTAAAA
jgi:N-ethylmaleimide reductase